MPVPGFQKYFLPFLELVKDGKEHAMSELYEPLANHFKLTNEDKKELLPSGLQTRHINRVQWTRTFLKKALLIESSSRGKVRIIERGIKVLAENPKDINIKFLDRFPEFKEFRSGTKSDESESILTPILP